MKKLKFVGVASMAIMLMAMMLFTGCKKEVSISSIKLSSNAETIKIGQTVALSYTCDPTDANVESAVWSSSAESVATVDQKGVVTGVAEGTANIIVKVNDQFTATCAVTVATNITGIKLSCNTLTIKEDSILKLTYTVDPKDAKVYKEEWLSSNDDVVYVDQYGFIDAFAAGTAVITLKVNGQFTDTCTVTVEKNIPPMTGITISSEAETIKIDSTFTLTYTVEPADAKVETAVWSSSAETVATVDQNGVVKGIAEGTATITITVNGKFTKTCTVTVEKNIPPMTGITISSEAETIEVDATFTLTYTVEPADAKVETAVWSSSAETVATVDQNGVVKGIAEGTATITITVNDTFTKTCAVTVEKSGNTNDMPVDDEFNF